MLLLLVGVAVVPPVVPPVTTPDGGGGGSRVLWHPRYPAKPIPDEMDEEWPLFI